MVGMVGFALFLLKGSFLQTITTHVDVVLPHRIKKGEGKLKEEKISTSFS